MSKSHMCFCHCSHLRFAWYFGLNDIVNNTSFKNNHLEPHLSMSSPMFIASLAILKKRPWRILPKILLSIPSRQKKAILSSLFSLFLSMVSKTKHWLLIWIPLNKGLKIKSYQKSEVWWILNQEKAMLFCKKWKFI